MRKLPKDIFITGIDTNIGKTVASAVLVEALKADYWKPVQSGNTEGSDTETVRGLISNTQTRIHTEAYSFKAPTVPAYAAMLEDQEINKVNIILPHTTNRLIVEGAGGLMVHLDKNFMIIDLIMQLDLPVILVSKNYVGSINHTMLSIEALRKRNIDILGIIYNGERSAYMRELILHSTGVPDIGSIDEAREVNRAFVKDQAAHLLSSLSNHFVI